MFIVGEHNFYFLDIPHTLVGSIYYEVSSFLENPQEKNGFGFLPLIPLETLLDRCNYLFPLLGRRHIDF